MLKRTSVPYDLWYISVLFHVKINTFYSDVMFSWSTLCHLHVSEKAYSQDVESIFTVMVCRGNKQWHIDFSCHVKSLKCKVDAGVSCRK